VILKCDSLSNGNIAEVDWKTSNDNILKRYSYSYDSSNRLNYGHYSEPMSTVPTENHFGESLEYDLNGNITRLYRNTKNTANGMAMQIDNLTYKYFGNQLRSVKDESQNNSGYPYFTTPNPMEYDNNGNIKFHKDKMINKIVYNYLNLPSSINMLQRKGLGSFQGNMITHKYRSDGVKLEKTVNFVNPYTADLTNVEYLDGFQYERKYNKSNTAQQGSDSGYVLQFVPNSEGYFDFVKNKYIYNYTDHLGNVRMNYLNNGSGIEVLDESNYYPFGLMHIRSSFSSGMLSYTYRYNGKELQRETGQYDYGARMYMPDIGRWGVIDPKAELSQRWSAYTYAYNNPIRYVDPDGMFAVAPIDYIDDKGKKIGTDGTDIKGTIIITNRSDQNAIKSAEKKGEHISTDQLSTLNSNMFVPFDNELSETMNVIERESANGGLSEEASSIGSTGAILRSPTGLAPTISADGSTATASTKIQFNGILQGTPITSIHSHSTSIIEGKGGTIYPLNALTPTPGVDDRAFSNYHTNIITGRLEVGNSSNITRSGDGSYKDNRPVGAAVYNRDGSLRMTLTVPVIKNILNRNAK